MKATKNAPIPEPVIAPINPPIQTEINMANIKNPK